MHLLRRSALAALLLALAGCDRVLAYVSAPTDLAAHDRAGEDDRSRTDARGDLVAADRSRTDARLADISKPDASGPLGPLKCDWAKLLGGVAFDRANRVAVAATGDVYLVGVTAGNAEFGGSPLPCGSPSPYGVVLASYTPAGGHRWTRCLGKSSDVNTGAIAVDGSGNVFVGYALAGTIDLGGGPIIANGDKDILLASFTAGNVHRWSKGFGGAGTDRPAGLAVDASGDIYVTGEFFSATINLGGGALANKGSYDLYLASYTNSGQHRWSYAYGDASEQHGAAVVAGSSGQICLLGSFAGTVGLGGGNLASAGGTDLLLAQFSSTGVHQWSKRYGAGGGETAHGLAIDGLGNLYATGEFQGQADFGGGLVSTTGVSSDVFVASYAGSGVHRWSKAFGTTSYDSGAAVAVDAGGDVTVTGASQGGIDFGGGPVSGKGATDTFLVSLVSSSGAHRWSKLLGGAGACDAGFGLAVSGASTYVTGVIDSPGVLCGTSSTVGPGACDAFLLKMSP